MDSEDGMLDAYDVDSAEDYYAASDYDDDEVEHAMDGLDDNVNVIDQPQNNFTILKESDICQRQEEDIARVSSVLSISRVEASILLRYCKWNVSLLHDEWFLDEERVRIDAGLLSKPTVQYPNTEMTCGICFDLQPIDNIHSAACTHLFCASCWRGYITTAINDGPVCLFLKCPNPSCTAAVGEDMINKFATDEDKEKFSRYLICSYIEDNRKAKWCPAPDCTCAVEFDHSSSNYDVSCFCSYTFCWNCSEEAHRPVDCSTVSKWILKNSEESENMNWILANSKPCPKCKRPIEKNQGCMHMTCRPPCRHEFCWLCLGTWSEHGKNTGGFYACNKFETAKQEGQYDQDEKKREMAKNTLERYMHYYERWSSNQLSSKKAIQDLQEMKNVKLEQLEKIEKQAVQLKFIIEAWQQIVECRRVLKWTYAYGYYLPECEHAKKQLFEYLQGEAETALERLHQCAEKDLRVFLVDDDSVGDFAAFRTKLISLTRVTRTYFENLVRALENGLSDVSTPSSSKNVEGENQNRDIDLNSVMYWTCDRCMYANPLSVTLCMMCTISRID